MSHSRRVTEVMKLKDRLEAHFAEHPQDRGRHWEQRRFNNRQSAGQWMVWMMDHFFETGLGPPDYAIASRGRYVYITRRTEAGEAWDSAGRPVPQPLYYRRWLAKIEKEKTDGE